MAANRENPGVGNRPIRAPRGCPLGREGVPQAGGRREWFAGETACATNGNSFARSGGACFSLPTPACGRAALLGYLFLGAWLSIAAGQTGQTPAQLKQQAEA